MQSKIVLKLHSSLWQGVLASRELHNITSWWGQLNCNGPADSDDRYQYLPRYIWAHKMIKTKTERNKILSVSVLLFELCSLFEYDVHANIMQ